jgi:hypothetical protein
VDIPATAFVVDFVFSDLGQQHWDNNDNKDFHTAVTDTATPEAMQEMMYQVGHPAGVSGVCQGCVRGEF